jgi:uncharacterized protein (TIGR02466 family)
MAYGEIHSWFPKVIYLVDNLLPDELPSYETRIKSIISNSDVKRNNMLNVDSTHKISDSLHEDAVFKNLVDEIYLHSEKFLSELGYTTPFIKKLKIGNMWANLSHEGDFLFPHIHPHSLLSGAFYIKKASNSKIKFFNELTNMLAKPQNTTPLSYDFCEYDCNPGRLIIFKSDFLHSTQQQQDGEKIVISFNIGIY